MGVIGACGIACEVCKLYIEGKCKGCVPGRQAEMKLEMQVKMFGMKCPALECAFNKKIDYCIRDCPDFPCQTLFAAEFPYSKRFLEVMKMARGK